MADYSGAGINTLYGTILGLSSGNITSALKTVQDGDGNDTALQVATGRVKSTGTIESAGNAVIGGSISATNYTGSASGLSNIQSGTFNVRATTTNVSSFEDNDNVIFLNTTGLTVTLPTAADVDGRAYTLINNDSAGQNISLGGQTIISGGAKTTTDKTLAAFGTVTIMSVESLWVVVSGAIT